MAASAFSLPQFVLHSLVVTNSSLRGAVWDVPY